MRALSAAVTRALPLLAVCAEAEPVSGEVAGEGEAMRASNDNAGTCIRCGERPKAASDRYCRPCRNGITQLNRKRHSELSTTERLKANCRSYTNVLIKRGELEREPCGACGDAKVQAHHPDYSNPRLVIWLCKPCHKAHHERERQEPRRAA